MSLLLLFGGALGAPTFTPIAFGNTAVLLMPDEVAVGQECTVYMQVVDSSGPVALDGTPQYEVFGFTTGGVRSSVKALAEMTQVGSADLWAGTWTPTTFGTYEVLVVGEVSATPFPVSRSLTVRPKIDPIGFAIDDVMVSRMGNDETLGTV